MKWRRGRRSSNVEDRRGGRRGVSVGRGGALGCGGVVLVIALALLTGEDPLQLLGVLSQTTSSVDSPPAGAPSRGAGAPGDEVADFVSVVLADTEDTWGPIFAEGGSRYRPPTLVLFDDAVRSACGFNSAAVGPFYCPADSKVYLDLGFFSQLSRRFGAPGDFAAAYVIAHEVGHHVQNLLGISSEVHQLRSRVGRSEANALSVRMELQADCLAGVWGHHAERQRDLLETGDVEEGLRAAAAIGDDALQRLSTGRIQPESWTHGSSEQRVRWFRRGLDHGRLDLCDTFEAEGL